MASHKKSSQLPAWTKEKCQTIANACVDQKQMRTDHYQAFRAAYRAGWLQEIFCNHTNGGNRIAKFTSKEESISDLKRIAAGFATRGQMAKTNPNAYSRAHQNGVIDLLFEDHPNRGFEEGRVARGHWQDKENCRKAALECKSKNEFRKKYSSAYSSALRNGWIDDFSAHMRSLGSLYTRYVYTIALASEKRIYVGLSHDPEERFEEHRRSGSAVVRKLIEDGAVLTRISGPLDESCAAALEKDQIKKFRTDGWIMANADGGGAVGKGIDRWNKEECRRVALKCGSRRAFQKNFGGGYNSAIHNGWLEEIFSSLPNQGKLRVDTGFWTEDKLHELAMVCESRNEFLKKHPNAYQAAANQKLLDRIFKDHPHQGLIKKKNGTWSLAACQAAAKQCTDRKEFKERFPGAHAAAVKNHWLDELFENHAGHGYRKNAEWDYDQLSALVKQCATRSEFKMKHAGAYEGAVRRRLLDHLFAMHPNQGFKSIPPGFWTFERVSEFVSKVKTRKELELHQPGAFAAAHRRGWLNDLFRRHPNEGYLPKAAPNAYWTFEKCQEIVRFCRNRRDFMKRDPKAYDAAKSHGWMNELFRNHLNQGYRHKKAA
ncbi:MAG: GIY-YIG nuclease family protein [Methylotenera sp.]|nr:GIY-YIG nuclease family protein [Oligoflexia bacterium]